MPKEITDLRQFLVLTRKPGTKYIMIHKSTVPVTGGRNVGGTRQITKFKLRRSDYLFTMKVEDKDKAQKLELSLPPGLVRRTSDKKKAAKK